MKQITVGVNGYGVIGKRVADAIRALTGFEQNGAQSTRETDASLGVTADFFDFSQLAHA